MKCGTCGATLVREVAETSGKNGVAPGDVLISKSLVVLKSDGHIEVKCPRCSAMNRLPARPVFRRKRRETESG